MSYSDFTIEELKGRFGLRFEECHDLFSKVLPAEISPLLRQTLKDHVALAFAISTDKARSELIIAPVLLEVRRQVRGRVSFFSGVDFLVDAELGLRGTCDFLLG